jgi:glycosyltransferase involved in cell wall biosynthesis
MRLAYVTAHYPPDFTSGATLQVERIARRAAELGHDVEVFSGAIGMGLADGERRTETVDGVVVHWIGTADRIEQGDDGNWDNPFAAAAAAVWFSGFRPDLVHVHTLQTLGVGVVEAAVDGGHRVVVTMHDLWWWCSRLFLVDTDLRPCPLVTDVDTCACARTPHWRAQRARRLATALDRVERILAPSAALRDVIVANGVDPARVSVDENDVSTSVVPVDRPVPDDDSAVRFVYLGGDSPLKGADVLRAAVGRLRDDGGWTVEAYGLSPTDGLSASVHPAAPFDPDELMAVLGGGDVLVIPSIARESFSIAAREALVAGLPVITTDCLGPEEVVLDGVNGLVVPTGDAEALAEAMHSLVEDRSLLARLRSGVREHPVRIRSSAEHVDALLASVATIPTVVARTRWNVAFVVGADGAIARYRVHHPSEALALHGGNGPIVHYLDPALDRVADGMDAVVLQRVPATTHILDLIGRWRAAGTLVVFDVDDLIVDPDLIDSIPGLTSLTTAERDLYLDGLHRYRTTLEHCDGAIVPTPALAQAIASTTDLPVAVVPNALGLVELRLAAATRSRRRAASDRVTLAYFSGSDTHQPDLDLLAGPLAQVLECRPAVDLLVVGPVTTGAELAGFGERVRHRAFQPWDRLYGRLADVDINLAPLVLPSAFNEAKSAIKWLEAAAVGVPTVASASGAFTDAIEQDATGVLCRSADDWVDELTSMVDDARRRRRIGRAAQRRAELHHGPHVTAVGYAAALDDLARRRSPQRSSSWTVRAPDERAPSAPPLAAYRVEIDAGADGRRRWWRRLVRR